MKDTPAIQLWHAGSSSDEPGLLERCCESVLSDEELLARKSISCADQPESTCRWSWHGAATAWAWAGRAGRNLFRDRKNGKPYVTQPSWARCPFNIAHTDGLRNVRYRDRMSGTPRG